MRYRFGHHGRAKILVGAAASLVLVSATLGAAISHADSFGGEALSISVSPDGSLTKVESKSGSSYEPAKVGRHLPVRLVTTYICSNKASSDADNIRGKTGLLQIDLQVTNTTGRMERISADVNGRSTTRDTVISQPYAIAATARLSGIDPSDIVTAKPDGTGANGRVTNGVVGTDKEGVTTVQWAGLTGVNGAGSVAHFSLVVNAHKSFTPPTIEVAAQPGFDIGSDPATQKRRSDLVASTIKTLADANKVIGQSGLALAKARQTLDEAGGHVGRKTLADLQESNGQITASANQVAQATESLDSRATSMFNQTGDHVAEEVATTTESIKRLLGNPDAATPSVSIDTTTCDLSTTDQPGGKPGQSDRTVLGLINGLSSRLEALSKTTGNYQQKILSDSDRSLGPEGPSAAACQGNSSSLTCVAMKNHDQMANTLRDASSRGETLIDKLRIARRTRTLESVRELGKAIEKIDSATSQLDSTNSNRQLSRSIGAVERQLDDVSSKVDKVSDALKQIHDTSADASAAVQTESQRLNEATMIVCLESGMTIPRGAEAAKQPTISRDTAKQILSKLSAHACPAHEGDAMPPATAGGKNSVEGQSAAVNEKIQLITAATDSKNSSSPVQTSLADLRSSIARSQTALGQLKQANRSDYEAMDAQIQTLSDDVDYAKRKYVRVLVSTGLLTNDLGRFDDEISDFVNSLQAQPGKVNDEGTKRILKSAERLRSTISTSTGEVFDGFAAQTHSQAEQLRAQGSQTVRESNERMDAQSRALRTGLKTEMRKNSGEVHDAATKAVHDSEAVSALLVNDINRVMADIGSPNTAGSGLLGAMASSDAQLGIAQAHIGASGTQVSLATSTQLGEQSASMLDAAAVRASIARLENATDQDNDDADTAGWYSFHIDSAKEK